MHLASKNGHTETAMALVEAGVDVHCKGNDGYGSSRLPPDVVGLRQCGAAGPSTPGWGCRRGCLLPCRWTALHLASLNGHTETALALVEAGADVHCTGNDGYGFSRLHPRVVGFARMRGRPVRPVGVGAAGGAVWAVQEDGAALGVFERPHGDGDGAGQGGRGRALQGRRRVRVLGLHPRVVGLRQCGAAGQSTPGLELQEWLFWPCRSTALHCASNNGHTETAMALVKAGVNVHGKGKNGYGSSGCILALLVRSECEGGRSVPSGVELQEWLFWLCRWTVVHYASQNGHTETAMALVEAGADVHCKANDGCGPSGCIVVT